MAVSKLLENHMKLFQLSSDEKVCELTEKAAGEVVHVLTAVGLDAAKSSYVLGVCTKLGISGTGHLNEEECHLVRNCFERYYRVPSNSYVGLIEKGVDEKEIALLKELMEKVGTKLAMSMLHYILGIAYSDGIIETHVTEQLDNLFGIYMKADLVNGGQEGGDNPSNLVSLDQNEREIIRWFVKNNDSVALNDIAAHFTALQKKELKLILDGLCEKRILVGGDNFAFCTYGLADEEAAKNLVSQF